MKPKDKLIQEATKLLEDWAKENNFVPKGKRMKVTIEIVDSELVSVDIKDRTTQSKIDSILARSIETLELSARPASVFKNVNIEIIGDLVRKTEEDLLKFRNFGRKALREVKLALSKLGLAIGMDVPVGPMEREILLKGSVRRYTWPESALSLEAAGIMSVNDFILKTEEEIIHILSHLWGTGRNPQAVFRCMRASITQRGVRY